jgi:hypothetical protein
MDQGTRTLERFWARVDKTDTCWLWTGSLNNCGYGNIKAGGRMTSVHRLSYEIAVGPIPEGYFIDHLCYVHHCVNPNHLQAVTRQQNRQNASGGQVGQRNNRSSGVRGVYWIERTQKWAAVAKRDGHRYYSGQYQTIEEATVAAVALRNRLMTNNLLDRAA